MRRIPVDSTKVKFISIGKSAARAKYAELSDGSRKRVPDAQDTDDQGEITQRSPRMDDDKSRR